PRELLGGVVWRPDDDQVDAGIVQEVLVTGVSLDSREIGLGLLPARRVLRRDRPDFKPRRRFDEHPVKHPAGQAIAHEADADRAATHPLSSHSLVLTGSRRAPPCGDSLLLPPPAGRPATASR